MFRSGRSSLMTILPAMLVMTSVGCSTLGRNKGDACGSCGSNTICGTPAPQYSLPPGSFPTPPNPQAPAPVPPVDTQDTIVPPPPVGEAAQPSTIQRMRGATTVFFLNANESVRSAFRR